MRCVVYNYRVYICKKTQYHQMQLIINGLVIGSIIAITAIGLSMIYKTLHFVNFAHGDIVTFAAYIALFANVI